MFAYNDNYLKTYKRYRDIMDTDVVVVLNKVGTQTEEPIFKIKALPRSRVYYDELGEEQSISSIVFFLDELAEQKSINLSNSVFFPVKDIKQRVKIIRFNGYSYLVEGRNINFFQNIVRFDLISQI